MKMQRRERKRKTLRDVSLNSDDSIPSFSISNSYSVKSLCSNLSSVHSEKIEVQIHIQLKVYVVIYHQFIQKK